MKTGELAGKPTRETCSSPPADACITAAFGSDGLTTVNLPDAVMDPLCPVDCRRTAARPCATGEPLVAVSAGTVEGTAGDCVGVEEDAGAELSETGADAMTSKL